MLGGEFLYGADRHKLSLPEFWIDRTPVTNAEFARFVEATGYRTSASKVELGAPTPAANGKIFEGRTGDTPAAPGQISTVRQTIRWCR